MVKTDVSVFDRIFGQRYKVESGKLLLNGKPVRESNGILRFTGDISYSTGNFSKLRENHARLQLDSVNKTNDRLQTILRRTNWSPDYFKGKLILECGCGAGADTEVLLKLGATVVAVDIAGVDACAQNIGHHPNVLFVQASITNLPFDPESFDIVWCHRVLQHTPNPNQTLKHILQFVKNDGSVFIHSYARNLAQMVSWKYALRPITRRMDPEKLYYLIEKWTPYLYHFTCALRRVKPALIGRMLFRLSQFVVPIRNYRFDPSYAAKDDRFLIEYAIHDTFDALSPRYDSPLAAEKFQSAAQIHLSTPYEIVCRPGVTLLRSTFS